MILLTQIKLKIPHEQEELTARVLKILGIGRERLLSMRIQKRSLDARKKPDLYYIYSVLVEVTREKELAKLRKNPKILFGYQEKTYQFAPGGTEVLTKRPVVVGMGPAGLFCAYQLALYGYAPILIERGRPVEDRMQDVETFWKDGVLHPESNVQFGEGGAGTFSDGKLNTLVKDKYGRNSWVLQRFVEFGAPKNILYEQKPHIGTDLLVTVVQNMRRRILELGGTVYFEKKLTGIRMGPKNTVSAIEITDVSNGEMFTLDAEVLVLAIGHSARDTFFMLKDLAVPMQAKSFAVGVRVEHRQQTINLSQYGEGDDQAFLPAAAYKLTAKSSDGRGVYTFCMCPGGYVVNASSEEECLAVNGMSYQARDGENANSAVIVTVTPEDYGTEDVLSGVHFQRELERKAYLAGRGRIPVQTFSDFEKGETTVNFGTVKPQMKGAYQKANLCGIFPEKISLAIAEGIHAFGKSIPAFDDPDALLSGVESRTSSPVRILRDEELFSSPGMKGIYPCGEGAGYAGGIMSAAMDGIKTAEAIMNRYEKPLYTPDKIC